MARLVEAAEKLIRERGYEATSSTDIAAEAGVAPSLINAHFLGKAGLLYAVLRNFNDQQLAATRMAASRPGTPTERLAGILHTWAECDLAEPRMYAAITGLSWSWPPETEREYAADLAIFWDVVMAVVDEGIAQGEFRRISRRDATDIIFSIHQWGMRPGIFEGADAATCAERVIGQVMLAIAAPGRLPD
ncbi:TetR/AcrR family transcriptional regulator [Roseomonas sp. CECT 9278]|uniref:TetR/AcrR family transcriptional regulator n=1 Tax=Roseomonas sp. CECT 9278 TaxID=2845823 RepID=UPI001E61D599|nr:TetR/AcrR family transcriptional regulator [Roseomonas sp. CECT 9278]CAH0251077.1 HTH-type transcriptional regulator BetI [Roseomonas sp. CECT 9278]